jgi:4-hydroxy-tetrahydrodipicolinate synthase
MVISGDDNITLPILALGGSGVISVAANVDPTRMVALYDAMKHGDYQKALVLHYALAPLLRSMFIDTNPIPVKKAVELMGMAGGPVRLPLDELDEKKTEQLKKILATIPEKMTRNDSAPLRKPAKIIAEKKKTVPKRPAR